MIVRRVSYFTFIVAITTLASVSACHPAMAEAMLAEAENNMVSCSFNLQQHSNALTPYPAGITKVLREQGINSRAFKIVRQKSTKDDTVHICLVFDKDYKGQVSSKIFTVASQPQHSAVISSAPAAAATCTTGFVSADQRREIARRNLILLE